MKKSAVQISEWEYPSWSIITKAWFKIFEECQRSWCAWRLVSKELGGRSQRWWGGSDRAFWTILKIFFLSCAKWGIHSEITSRGVAISKLHLKQKSKVILAIMWKKSEKGKTNLEAITVGQLGLGCGEGEKWAESSLSADGRFDRTCWWIICGVWEREELRCFKVLGLSNWVNYGKIY